MFEARSGSENEKKIQAFVEQKNKGGALVTQTCQ